MELKFYDHHHNTVRTIPNLTKEEYDNVIRIQKRNKWTSREIDGETVWVSPNCPRKW